MDVHITLSDYLFVNPGSSFTIEASAAGFFISISRPYRDEFNEHQEDYFGNYFDAIDEGIMTCLQTLKRLENTRKRRRIKMEVVK